MNPVEHVNGILSIPDKFGDNCVESFHLTSDKDMYWPWGTNDHLHMDRPVRIVHQQGHKPPKYLDKAHLKLFDAFMKRQYQRKFGSVPDTKPQVLEKVAKL